MADLMRAIRDGIVEKTEGTRKLTFGGETKLYPVYSIPLDLPYFNNKNDRIATWIEEYRFTHDGQEVDRSDIEAYNAWVEDFIVKSNPERIEQTKNNIKIVGQQKVAGVVLADGRIIDGNRRFTCLRRLNRENPASFGRFEAVILDMDLTGNEKHIKMLELNAQFAEEERVDYAPIDRLTGLYNTVERFRELTLDEYAKSAGMKMSDAKKELGKAKLMEEFLEFCGIPYQFHFARKRKLNDPLKDIYGYLLKEKDDERREDMKLATFGHLALVSAGDTTRKIRDYMKMLKDPREGRKFLEDQLDIATELSDCLQDKVDEAAKKEGKKLTAAQQAAVITEELDALSDDSDLAKKSVKQTEETDKRIKEAANREQAANVLEDATRRLENIDKVIFQKLPKEQIETICENADVLLSVLQEIRMAAQAQLGNRKE